jgi:hypothetical protein
MSEASLRNQSRVTRAAADDAEQRANGAEVPYGVVVSGGNTTLASGVSPAVPVPSIKAGAQVVLTLLNPNGSTALGIPKVVVTAGTGFQITSLTVGTPASTQTGDDSTYAYSVIQSV